MINEKKVRLMTKTAVFEKQHKKDLMIHQYYKKDYISYHAILGFIWTTLLFLIVSGSALMVCLDVKPELIQKLDIKLAAYTLGMLYLAVFLIDLIVIIIVYSVRYEKTEKNIRVYQTMVNQLEKLYETEETEEKEISKRQVVRKKKGNSK